MPAWQPAANQLALRRRAALYETIRAFFRQRDVLEVETPVLASRGVTEPHIAQVEVPGHGWLQPSPEYHMKRLLAAGSGAIYQISRVFRAAESGRLHNPEFSLLEWYRPGFDLQDLIQECVALLQQILGNLPCDRHNYRALFHEVTGLDPVTAPLPELADYAARRCGPLPVLDRAALTDLLMSSCIEPALPRDHISIVCNFPGWAAALSKTHLCEDGQQTALRFEIYAAGLELANGYEELRDAQEQAERFARDRRFRQQRNLPDMLPDEQLLAALQQGLPACSGVAMGLDRLLMACHGYTHIHEVLTFPADRA